MTLTSIALFCGSAWGNSPKYSELAHQFGTQCAYRNLVLYYGGACVGLMDVAAKATLSRNGVVVGVSPTFFSKDIVRPEEITSFIPVETMSERKQLLEEKADAFVALPGAFGTMDELFELITDAQLGLHHKPVAILNAFGFYDHLLAQLQVFLNEGFLRPFHYDLLVVATTVEDLFEKLARYENSNDAAWLKKIKN